MKFFKGLKNWLVGGCVWYTLISLVFVIVCAATEVAGGATAGALLWLLPFSLSMSGAGMLFRYQGMPQWARCLAHYGVTMLAFFGFVIFPNNNGSFTASGLLVLFAALTVLYWILFLLLHIFRGRLKKLMEED